MSEDLHADGSEQSTARQRRRVIQPCQKAVRQTGNLPGVRKQLGIGPCRFASGPQSPHGDKVLYSIDAGQRVAQKPNQKRGLRRINNAIEQMIDPAIILILGGTMDRSNPKTPAGSRHRDRKIMIYVRVHSRECKLYAGQAGVMARIYQNPPAARPIRRCDRVQI